MLLGQGNANQDNSAAISCGFFYLINNFFVGISRYIFFILSSFHNQYML